eukprot:SAG31_NODE_10137_length_1179_cov_0.805556_1_plen_160_part_00
MALQALHVAYAYQSIGNTSSANNDHGQLAALPPGAAVAQSPYAGFADGPKFVNATVTGVDQLILHFRYAEGLTFMNTYGCGRDGYKTSGCCEYNRTFETSRVKDGWNSSVWDVVAPNRVEIIAPSPPPKSLVTLFCTQVAAQWLLSASGSTLTCTHNAS